MRQRCLTLTKPYWPGLTRRAGAPWSASSGRPARCSAMSTSFARASSIACWRGGSVTSGPTAGSSRAVRVPLTGGTIGTGLDVDDALGMDDAEVGERELELPAPAGSCDQLTSSECSHLGDGADFRDL